MIEIIIFLLGGVINTFKFHKKINGSTEDLPHLNQGYFIAFIMGSIIYGSVMYVIYLIIS